MMVLSCDINMSLFFLLLYDTACCVFSIGFILFMCNTSLIISLTLLSALSNISMSEASIMCPGFSSLWQRMADSLFLPFCSLRYDVPVCVRFWQCRFRYMFGILFCIPLTIVLLSLKGNFFPISFGVLKATLKSICLKFSSTSLVGLVAKF